MISPQIARILAALVGVLLLFSVVFGAGYACYNWGYQKAEKEFDKVRTKEAMDWQLKLSAAKTRLEVKGVEFSIFFTRTVVMSDKFRTDLDEAEKVEPEFASITRPPYYSRVRHESRKAVTAGIACAYGSVRECIRGPLPQPDR